jgi:hypothetical protein
MNWCTLQLRLVLAIRRLLEIFVVSGGPYPDRRDFSQWRYCSSLVISDFHSLKVRKYEYQLDPV